MDSSAFNGLAKLEAALSIGALVFVLLGLWKAVEIICWVFHHVAIHWKS